MLTFLKRLISIQSSLSSFPAESFQEPTRIDIECRKAQTITATHQVFANNLSNVDILDICVNFAFQFGRDYEFVWDAQVSQCVIINQYTGEFFSSNCFIYCDLSLVK